MLKVECEGCRAPYRVDERRVPPGGLKMRCPKCGATFMVKKGEPSPAPPTREHPAPPPPSLHTETMKRTVVGIGILPGASPAPAPAAPPDDFDAELPVVPPGGRAAPSRSTADDLDLPVVGRGSQDLPAPARPAPPRPEHGSTSADLPLPARAAPPRPTHGSASADLPLPASGRDGLLDGSVRDSRPAPPPLEPHNDLADFGDLPLPLPTPTQADFPIPAPVLGDLPLAKPRDNPLLDLPSLAGFADLPTSSSTVSGDRPARQITGAALGFDDDPPPPSPTGHGVPPGEIDLSVGFGELDLPLAVDAALPAVTDRILNLPAPLGATGDLPSPSDSNQYLPLPFDVLPVPSDGRKGLPVPSDGRKDLPAVREQEWNVPSPIGHGLQPPPRAAESDDYELDLAIESSGPAPLQPSRPPQEAVFPFAAPVVTGSLRPGQEFPGPSAPNADAFGAFDSIAPLRSEPDEDSQVRRQAGGGTSFGEVNLSGGEGSVPPGMEEGVGPSGAPAQRDAAAADDDMEFGAIPQETERAQARDLQAAPTFGAAATPSSSRVSGTSPAMSMTRKPKALRILLAALLVGLGGGLALSATSLGAFGAHFISDTVNAGRNQRLFETSTEDARKLFAADTAAGATKALAAFDAALSRAPRHASLAAYAAFLGFLREVRFGADPEVHAHAIALLNDASERSPDDPSLSLARTAESAADGEAAKARQLVASLARRQAQNVDVVVLQGEVDLLAKEYNGAQGAWERAAKLEDSARTAFGRARAYEGLGDLENAKSSAEKALSLTKSHVGARLLLARYHRAKGDSEKASAVLLAIVDGKEGLLEAAGKQELVDTHTLLGQLHLERSRMSASEEAFAEALKLNPKYAAALCGFGEVLYREGRYAEALARYEAGIQANAESVDAKIGAAKTKIALERLQEAKELLRKVRESRPADPAVAYWLAKAEEALGNKTEVEKILVDAIGRDPKGAPAISLYVSLAQFLAAQGRMQEADAKLSEARRKLPDSPAIHKALGNVALAAGRLSDAKSEFEVALQRDTNDLSSVFNLGVTLRRMGRFDEAQEKFDQVATVDKNYPGLALERGVLFEAAGQARRALEMYQEALSKAPNDPD
ncbi:MAG: zinc-ribbon domain-containing protein, partial [Polyangiaceae bacterium]|nr:zinc-ribbon domain-containing protein [Polyangiaceae bacterium]